MRSGCFRHELASLFLPNNGLALARAFCFASKSTFKYLLVVLTLTCPSQWAMVLKSTPERSRKMAVLWRMLCG